MTVIREFDSKRHKVTIEEVRPEEYIVTLWNKEVELEADRSVFKFETYGGALGKALDLTMDILMSMEGFEEV